MIVGVASGLVIVGVGVSVGGMRVAIGDTDGSGVNVAEGMEVGVETGVGIGVGVMQPAKRRTIIKKRIILFMVA